MDSDDLSIRSGLHLPADELHWSTSRSSGPGGQHVNKTSTRVTVRWSVRDSRVLGPIQRERLLTKLASRLTREGELIVHADDSRSQSMNRIRAGERLAELVREGLRVPKARRKTKPTKGSQRRRVDAKKRRAGTKKLRGRVRREE